ncbi:TonB-dependent receptor [Novosphingobium resinovorum]|uniref:TonB-dependent receptor n=1 Tax=Novosphingobium resinovorum TaxID=158500 RepID=UPI002ED4F433
MATSFRLCFLEMSRPGSIAIKSAAATTTRASFRGRGEPSEKRGGIDMQDHSSGARRRSLRVGTAVAALSIGALCVPIASRAAPAPPTRNEPQVLQDIIVTAERRSSDVQKTAASVTVQSGEDLLARGKFTLRSILETVPGVSGGESEGVTNEPTGNDSPSAGITIRGVSSNGGLAGQTLSGVPATALYVDGVYSGIGGNFDVDRVEVLRGPQGTLYGRSATAGLVAIHTRNPDLGRFGVEGAVEAGSYDLLHVSGAINVPLVEDQLGLRVAANHYERDGVDVGKGFGASRVNEAKAKLLIQPGDRLTLLVGGAFQDKRLYNGGVSGNLVEPAKVEYQDYSVGSANTKFRQLWAEARLDIGDAQLTYLPAYRTWKQDAEVFVVGPGGGTLKQIVSTPHDEFITHELRLSSGEDSQIHWQTGLFYYYNDIRSSNRNAWEASNGSLFEANIRRKTRDVGIFAEATIPVASALRLTAGIRYDKTAVATQEVYTSNLNVFCNTPLGGLSGCAVAPANSASAGLPESPSSITVAGQAGRRTFKNVTYKVRAEYDLTPTSLLYGSISTAFLPGDVQVGTGAGNVPTAFPYESEKLTAFEVGSKNRFFGRRLQVNVGLFHYSYAGYQASVQLDLSNPASAVLFNVPLRMTGAEIETLFQVTSADRIGLNFSHIESKFHDLPAGFAEAVAQRELWGFAPTTGTVFFDHEFRLDAGASLNLHAEAIARSSYDVLYTSPALAAQGGLAYLRQKPNLLANFNATWTSGDGRFSLTGYVRNLTNKRIKTYVNLQSVTPLQATATQSDPRTVGAVFTAKL